LLCDDREDADDRVFEDAARVQVLLRVALVAYAASGKAVQALERFEHPFAREQHPRLLLQFRVLRFGLLEDRDVGVDIQ
jgi:hypothetical protein